MRRFIVSVGILLCVAVAACSGPQESEPVKQGESALIKRPKIIEFPTSVYLTLPAAHTAAETHRIALVAAGDTWATPGWPGAGPIDRLDESAAGLFIGSFYGNVNGVEEPRLPDPVGTNRILFVHANYFVQPP